MQEYIPNASVCVFIFFFMAACAAAADWQPLFNGKDLAGWHPVGGQAQNWHVKEGVLACDGTPGAEWLATDEQFADFELALEFNVPANGNSGVFIRAPQQGAPWVEGLEIQILDDFGDKWKRLSPEQFTGAIYAVVAPSKRVTKEAGQWQTMRISCVGRRVQVSINGQQVVDANLDDFSERADKVPGLKRASGHIGLQNHGDEIFFRNIRLREINGGE